MTWIDKEIAVWTEWLNLDPARQPMHEIPARCQIGKVLEHCNGDLVKARAQIAFNIQADQMLDSFRADTYWPEILRRFDTLVTNQIMMEDDND